MVHGLSSQTIRFRGFTGKVFINRDLGSEKEESKDPSSCAYNDQGGWGTPTGSPTLGD
jgi:hypothetical protein